MRPQLEALESRAAPSALVEGVETLATFRQAYPGAVTRPTPGFVAVADFTVAPGADASLAPGEQEILHGWFQRDPRLAANNPWLIRDQKDGVPSPPPAAPPVAAHPSAPADEQAVDFLLALGGRHDRADF